MCFWKTGKKKIIYLYKKKKIIYKYIKYVLNIIKIEKNERKKFFL
jgi:hypothetical protein